MNKTTIGLKKLNYTILQINPYMKKEYDQDS